MHQGLPADTDQIADQADQIADRADRADQADREDQIAEPVADRLAARVVVSDRPAAIERSGAAWRASVAEGLRGAWRQRGLVLLIWVAFLLLAAFATMPTWRACGVALDHTPESERLLDGLNIALIREMSTSDSPASAVTLPWMMMASALMALLWNPFVSGGMLSVLLGANGAVGGSASGNDGGGSVRERFFFGGGRHYWRLFRLLLTMVGIGVVMLGLAGTVLFAVQSGADERGWERMSLALTGVNLALLGALAGLLSMITDYARVAIVRDGRRLVSAIWAGTRLLLRRPLAVIAFGLTFALLLGLLTGLYAAASSALSFRSWTAILLGILLQQLFSLTRTGLRVAMVAGELPMLPAPPPVIYGSCPQPEPAAEVEPVPTAQAVPTAKAIPADTAPETPAVPARQDADLNDLPPLA